MSLGARLVNVFAAPGELFSSVAASPFSPANWLVPATIVGLIGLIYSLVLFSQPALVQQIRDLQDREIQKQVDRGKIPPEAAERAKAMMEGIGMTIARVAAAASSVVMAYVGPLWWGFVAWVVGRLAFRSPVGYMRTVEVAALASLVGLVGMLVSLFLQIGMGTLFAGLHLGMFVGGFDMTNRGHLALGALNAFSVWQTGLLSLGLARLIARPFAPTAIVVFGLWAGYKAVAVILGLAQFAL